MSVNREYKSDVFTELFSDPEMLITLYNAVSHSSLPLDTPVDITTEFLEAHSKVQYTSWYVACAQQSDIVLAVRNKPLAAEVAPFIM